MTQIKLNKSSLSKEQVNLKNYRKFLPSLDLKRRKILAERNIAQQELQTLKQENAELEKFIADNFPMFAATNISLNKLLKIESVAIDHENIVGVTLPYLTKINFTTTAYSYFNAPHWLDNLIAEIKKLIEMRIRLKIAKQRTEVLEKSLQTVTQRTNLFEKVLIPKTVNVIKYIQIFLADSERAGIVRSKIAKKKRTLQ